MREIKFRAWNKAFKRWSEHSEHGELELLDDGDGIVLDYLQEEIEVMQFTGLKDKNGNEVYEGDIDASSKHGLRVVIFDDVQLCFVLLWTERYDRYKKSGLVNAGCTYEKVTSKKKLNIVGNIYENHELLKQ